MRHLYLFTLEVAPLEVGETYEELPSRLTLMSRFWSELLDPVKVEYQYPQFVGRVPKL